MSERAYTLSEIDKMREAFRNKLRPPPLNLSSGTYMGDPWGDHQKYVASCMKEAEEQLRTFMIANGDPSELLHANGPQGDKT